MNGAAPSIPPLGAVADPLADPLVGLRDWHLPEPVSWWPPAPGWWLVAALGLVLAVVGVRWWRVRRRRTAPTRAALAELAALRSRHEQGVDGRSFAAAISVLLRRLALARYPRERVAGLAGRQWLDFLDRTGGSGGFTQGPGRILAEAPYRQSGQDGLDPGLSPARSSEGAGLADLADRWIRANRKPRP